MPKGQFDRKRTPPEIRFWRKVDRGGDSECWLWKGAKGGSYGYFWDGVRWNGVHRYSLELRIGRSLSSDEFCCHTCDTPLCVNPNHLFIGDAASNSKDMTKKLRKERGVDVHGAVLTDELVLILRGSYAVDSVTISELIDRYVLSCDIATVWYALTGKTWKHVGGPLVLKSKFTPTERVNRRWNK